MLVQSPQRLLFLDNLRSPSELGTTVINTDLIALGSEPQSRSHTSKTTANNYSFTHDATRWGTLVSVPCASFISKDPVSPGKSLAILIALRAYVSESAHAVA